MLIALLGIQACATLPDAEQTLAEPRASAVAFESAAGAVSTQRSAAIIDRLQARAGETEVLEQHLAHEQAINLGSPLVLGNRLQLLQDGPATYEAMFAAIRAAREHIHLETFIFEDDEIGRQFATLLRAKQAEGVAVRLIYDSVGCLTTPRAFFDRLRDGGVQVVEFNPVNPLAKNSRTWLVNNRDHRKLLIVDGHTAFVGGINISKVYSSSPFARRGSRKKPSSLGWRDTHSRITGPVVAEFQTLFLDSWARQQGPPLVPRNHYPALAAEGGEIVRAIGSRANDPQSPIYLTLLSAISHAERSVRLTIAYFAPDAQLLQALTEAARRGVDVELILPSHSDSWPVFHLGRSHYRELLRAGVKIHERRGGLMHAKTATIDGVWSTVGSSNLDWRSFLHNDELNAVILGRDFAVQMDGMFARDLGESEPIVGERWRQRPLLDRLREQVARLGAYWL